MQSLYNLSQDAITANQIIEFGITQSFTEMPTDSPTNYSNLRMWYKADSLTGSYSQSQAITSWANSAPGWSGYPMTFTGGSTTLNTASFSGSSPGQKMPSVYMSGSKGAIASMGYPGTDLWTIVIISKDMWGYQASLGNNASVINSRGYFGSNVLYSSNGLLGYGGASSTLSSPPSMSAITWFSRNSGLTSVNFYEGKTSRGNTYVGYSTGTGLFTSFNEGAWPGEVVEICFWATELNSTQIASLHDNYFRQKYYYERFFDAAPAKTTTASYLPPSKLAVSSSMVIDQTGLPIDQTDPTSFPTLALWLKADSLTASYSQSQVITNWPNSAPNVNNTASATGGWVFTTGSISGSSVGKQMPSAIYPGFFNSINLSTPIVLSNNKNYTIVWMTRGMDGDYMFTEGSPPSGPRIYHRSANNDIGAYNGSTSVDSDTFSSALTQSVVQGLSHNSYGPIFAENNIYRGGGFAWNGGLSLSKIAWGAGTGQLVEVCVWSGSNLEHAGMARLYNAYFKQKYYTEPLIDTGVTQSLGYTLASSSIMQVQSQIIEESNLSNQFSISQTGNIKARCFSETGIGSPGNPAPFNPATAGNLLVWWSADYGTFSGSYAVNTSESIVNNWTSRGGTQHPVTLSQANLSAAPRLNTGVSNGNTALRFRGTDFLTDGLTLEQPASYFFVMKWYDTNQYQALIDWSFNRHWMGQYPAGRWDMYGSADVDVGPVDGNYNVIFMQFSGSTSRYAFNKTGSSIASGNPGTNNASSIIIGRGQAGGNYANVDFCELLAYTGSLSQTGISAVMNYLGTKYGITIT